MLKEKLVLVPSGGCLLRPNYKFSVHCICKSLRKNEQKFCKVNVEFTFAITTCVPQWLLPIYSTFQWSIIPSEISLSWILKESLSEKWSILIYCHLVYHTSDKLYCKKPNDVLTSLIPLPALDTALWTSKCFIRSFTSPCSSIISIIFLCSKVWYFASNISIFCWNST